MLVSEFNYHLPAELIAQEPLMDRAASRLLCLNRPTGQITDLVFRDLPNLLRRGDLLVFNNTRVFPARLYGRRTGAKAQPLSPKNPASREFLQGRVEVLLTRQLTESDWEALVRPGRKISVGERLSFDGPDGAAQLQAEVISRGEFGERVLRFTASGNDFFTILESIGHIPLPPYIDRPDAPRDRDRYQTIFAREDQCGSAAAPTAGLHFTPEILAAFRERGIETAEITLHVGLGTFQPLRNENVENNVLHRERYSISAEAAGRVNASKSEGRRVVAIGTTTVRTLEFAAAFGDAAPGKYNSINAGSGEVDLFIYPGFRFRIVDALLTNFHLPKSSLLMLVSAFAGRDQVLRAYQHAVAQRYRFFSYGDCMFIE